MADFDALLAREAQMMGREVEYMRGWKTVVNDDGGVEHEIAVVVYRLPARKAGEIDIPTSYRVAVYLDGRPEFSGVV